MRKIAVLAAATALTFMPISVSAAPGDPAAGADGKCDTRRGELYGVECRAVEGGPSPSAVSADIRPVRTDGNCDQAFGIDPSQRHTRAKSSRKAR